MKEYSIYRLIKSEDLNHHGTLFAGRAAEWFVESSFIAASGAVNSPENIVCVNIHGMRFKTAVKKGEIIHLESKIAHLGITSITVYTKIHSVSNEKFYPIDGFITFVHVDLNGEKIPHNLKLDDPIDGFENNIRNRAMELFKK